MWPPLDYCDGTILWTQAALATCKRSLGCYLLLVRPPLLRWLDSPDLLCMTHEAVIHYSKYADFHQSDSQSSLT